MSDSPINNSTKIGLVQKALLVFLYGVLAVHFFIAFYTILFHSVTPVSRDQWFMYEAFINNGFWDALFTPFSNHLTVIPNLFFLIDFHLFSASNYFLVASSFISIIVIAWMFYLLLIRQDDTAELSHRRSTLHHQSSNNLTLFAWLLFCLFYLNNFALQGWGFIGTQHYLTFCFFLMAIYCYQKYRLYSSDVTIKNSTPAIFLLIMATFCFGGFLVWPAMIATHIFFRGPKHIAITFIISMFVCLLIYFLLSGEQSHAANQQFSFTHAIVFYFSLLASPIFYFFRVFEIFEATTIKTLALPLGVILFLVSSALLYKLFRKNNAYSVYQHTLLSFLFLGLGAPLVIIIFRNPIFWDPFVDRYQIWATCFYLGLPVLSGLKKPVAQGFLILLILLLALPSQVQLSQRVIDYRQNVERGLLDYQNGFADQKSLQEVLHFGWQNKLETFQTVFAFLQSYELNALKDRPALPSINMSQYPACTNIKIVQQKVTDLILEQSPNNTNQAARFYINAPYTSYRVYILDDNQQVTGMGQHLKNSLLPRNLLKWKWNPFNGYASTNAAQHAALMLIVSSDKKTGCISRFPGR